MADQYEALGPSGTSTGGPPPPPALPPPAPAALPPPPNISIASGTNSLQEKTDLRSLQDRTDGLGQPPLEEKPSEVVSMLNTEKPDLAAKAASKPSKETSPGSKEAASDIERAARTPLKLPLMHRPIVFFLGSGFFFILAVVCFLYVGLSKTFMT
ncbi:hypothetical protein L596_017969 [Steinernema carpocapsae]|uniref:Uncharacterized protein n=1 Tax=Steinernema carpocapsae TaxID=34508 RepID=A0A4U5N382_STECR|nr:hypothetical protein L596_017969 [Steinernema carpocapsae]